MTAARPLRHIRVSVIGHIDLTTDDTAPEAVEHVRRLLDQVFERFGFQLGVSGLELLPPLSKH
jgi:hypothetical protein